MLSPFFERFRHASLEDRERSFRSAEKKGGVLLPLAVLRIVRKSSVRAGIELPSRLLVPAHTLSAAGRTATGRFACMPGPRTGGITR
jgi:hypothetical protein